MPFDSSPVVLFLGLTQSGKSSLVASILRYAGDEEKAKTVEIGRNNLSTTQDVFEYLITVPKKEHKLRYKNGGERLTLVDQNVDMEEVELEEVELEEGIHGGGIQLRLFDSPGLSDSGKSTQENEEKNKPKARGIIDERHKLKVMCALSDAGRINSVCFVIKRGQPFGDDFQRHMGDYLKIFQENSLLDKIHFHVLHTQMDPPYRFKRKSDGEQEWEDDDEAEVDERILWTTHRAETFEEIIGIKATHHWMDNEPSKRNPIAQYFSKVAIAQLMLQLNKDSPNLCSNLLYPKGQLHRLSDKDVKASYDALIFRLEYELKGLKADLLDLERKLRPLISRREGYWSEITKLDPKISKLDTTELEVVGKESRFKGFTWDNWEPTLYFRIEASATIREIELDPRPPPVSGRWNTQSSTKEHYYADYQANTWCNANASIVLKGYKKDVHADEITRYRKQQEGFREDVTKINDKIIPMEAESSVIKGKIKKTDTEILALKEQRRKLDGESFPLQSFRDKSRLFLSGGPYSICEGYGLTTIVAKSNLPRHTIDRQEVYLELWTVEGNESKMWSASQHVSSALQEDLEKKTELMKELEKLHTQIIKSSDAALDKIEGNAPHEVKPPVDGNINESFNVSPDLEEALEKLQARSERCRSVLEGLFFAHYVEFNKKEEWISEAVDDIKVLVAKSATANAEYSAVVRRHYANFEAARKAIELLAAEEISIGAFTVLSKGIERKLSNPYMLLHEEIAKYVQELFMDAPTPSSLTSSKPISPILPRHKEAPW